MSLLLKIKKALDAEWCDIKDIGHKHGNDFYVVLEDGREYRFINDADIEDIFHEECMQTIQDCYNLENIPSFIEIDWKATTNNCLVDGYGHQFSSYDGNEIEIEDWHIFRTN